MELRSHELRHQRPVGTLEPPPQSERHPFCPPQARPCPSAPRLCPTHHLGLPLAPLQPEGPVQVWHFQGAHPFTFPICQGLNPNAAANIRITMGNHRTSPCLSLLPVEWGVGGRDGNGSPRVRLPCPPTSGPSARCASQTHSLLTGPPPSALRPLPPEGPSCLPTRSASQMRLPRHLPSTALVTTPTVWLSPSPPD